jgi:pimeloyl-ACP methyl ester carboxylesterase
MAALEEEGTLAVPGADLYFKIRGSGPMLVLIQGGGGDADGTDAIAAHLIGDHTVVTYDRRGLSRSILTDPDEAPALDRHTDDLHRLLAAVATGPVLAFGTSLGAFLGLDLVSRHPGQVSLLVAHEPPATQLLPEAERARVRKLSDEADAAGQRGEEAAALVEAMGIDFEDHEPGVEFSPPTRRQAANDFFFNTRDAPALDRHRLTISALTATRVVAAAGAATGTAYPRRCAEELAARIGTEVVEFPGSHVGLLTHPAGFAAKLREVLATRAGRKPTG